MGPRQYRRRLQGQFYTHIRKYGLFAPLMAYPVHRQKLNNFTQAIIKLIIFEVSYRSRSKPFFHL